MIPSWALRPFLRGKGEFWHTYLLIRKVAISFHIIEIWDLFSYITCQQSFKLDKFRGYLDQLRPEANLIKNNRNTNATKKHKCPFRIIQSYVTVRQASKPDGPASFLVRPDHPASWSRTVRLHEAKRSGPFGFTRPDRLASWSQMVRTVWLLKPTGPDRLAANRFSDFIQQIDSQILFNKFPMLRIFFLVDSHHWEYFF